jgi:hypothetical protein
MDEHHEKVSDVRDQIRQGEYRVEPKAVADAILRRLRDLAAARSERVRTWERAWAREHRLQMRCSYPESAPSPSVKTTSGGPARTRPIGVMASVIARLASALSTALLPDGGMQTQSS